MRSVYALRRWLPQLKLGGACTFLVLAFLSFSRCTRNSHNLSSHINSEENISACENSLELPTFVIKTSCQHSQDTPAIQALYVNQSFAEQPIISDILAADSHIHECAPGPFLFYNDNEIDTLNKRWQLSRMPNYFVLQFNNINNNSNSDEDFYISNQIGFPINCQSLKLQQDNKTIHILIPKIKLEQEKPYYLYVIQKHEQERHVWIQPLILAASAKK